MSQHKYGAKPTTVDNIRFASQKEARRYQELKLLEKAGEIALIEVQPRFPLCVAGNDGLAKHVGDYVADFRYIVRGYRPILDKVVVEDVKGVRTAVYRLKKRIVEAQYGITILET